MEREELGAWLRLTLTPGLGDTSARRLLAAFGPPETLYTQTPPALQAVLTPAQAEALLQIPEGWAALLDSTWAWLQAEPATRAVVALGDPAYPQALLNIEDPPLLLYLSGRLDLPLDSARSLAIVGSRNPTPQGALNARQFAMALAEQGLTIVSGLALGIDGAAHEGALAGMRGADRLATVAVVGTGADRVYPKSHHALAHRISERGLIVSEYPLGTPPLAANFPRRNRLIAGLSNATLVVEAALQSGSLITARLAAEQGKEVFAIPGSIHATQSRGCHVLIRQGAKLVESAQDVLEDLPGWVGSTTPSATPSPPVHKATDEVLQALGLDPVSLDALQARTGLDIARLQARLMALELEGLVARLPGGLLQRLVRG
ncbi:MAG: DNA-processing protein DprA [Pseudomonadota bacterium]|uniref:DNA-processing protein DprA n=1 Tax=Hylemonella sp. TaxID=2066020 RepID=UPI0035B00189